MTPLDIFVLLLLGGAALIGFTRGFAHEVLALMAWIAGIAAVKLFHAPLAARLAGSVEDSTSAAIVAFALLFLPTYVALRLFGKAVGHRTRRSILGPVDRVLGGGFGMLKGLLGATLVFLVANFATDLTYGPMADRPEWMTRSRTYPLLNASGRAVVDWVETRRHPGVTM
ncbi:CvpA family protein [Sphingomonas rhizophila]|uniref:CvpA family protein n=1 Tax=Sphingomonas rhizophila TaxID=2071607 RepID=A0A7G9SCC2_9SPHN|nr:CvpA family protein [Sphingomonas rhizophila]QNN65497.1 CvpA family protein [Sphingomonas rhizophila]